MKVRFASNLILLCCLTIAVVSCNNEKAKGKFVWQQTPDGISISENNLPVFFFQKKERVLNDSMRFSNYIHPLYANNGDTLTEIFPADHPFHRGIYWAWHQVYIDTLSAGDLWIMKDISQQVDSTDLSITDHNAVLRTWVTWQSPLYENNKPFLREQNTIKVYPIEGDIRKIDFEIQLHPLVDKLRLGGSDDEKGYGGFCLRLQQSDAILFTSSGGKVTPQLLQLNSGKWMDFSRPSPTSGDSIGVAILSHPSLPVFPAPWILRQSGSMQNIVFPGRTPVSFDDRKIILKYRLIVHNGGRSKINFDQLQREYESEK
jgi:Methane oxygenase PmoA